MQRRFVLGFAVLVAAVVAVSWFALRSDSAGDGPSDGGDASAYGGGAERGSPAPEAARRPRAGAAGWTPSGFGSVVGVVRVHGSRAPVVGASVLLEGPSPGPGRTLETTTDAAGAFVLDGADAFGGWTLRVRPARPLADAAVAGVVVEPGHRTDVGTLVLAPAFDVTGIVVDERGAPVAGAEVLAVRTAPPRDRPDVLTILATLGDAPSPADRAVSGDDGTFRLSKLLPGAHDFAAYSAGLAFGLCPSLAVTPGGPQVRIVMRRAHRLEGRVVRRGQGPVAGVPVVAFGEPKRALALDPLQKVFATSDDAGRFEFEGLPAQTTQLAALPPGEPAVIVERVTVPGETTVEIVLRSDASLTGVVTSSDGRPVSGARVTVLSEKARSYAAVVTDAQGRYAVQGLPDGDVVLFVDAAGHAPYPDDPEAQSGRGDARTKLSAGENRKDVTLAPGARVRGTVRDAATGAGVEGVDVRIVAGMRALLGARRATTDAEGRFAIEGVGRGNHLVIASKEGWHVRADDPEPGESGGPDGAALLAVTEDDRDLEHDVVVARCGTVRGRVEAPDGSPATGAQVHVVREAGRAGDAAATDPRPVGPDGVFEVPAPEPGAKFRVVAGAPGLARARTEELIATQGDLDGGTVRLRAAGSVAGRVTDATGQPIDDVVLRCAADGDEATTTSGADGTFRFELLPPGGAKLFARHPRCLPWRQDVTVAEGAPVTIDVQLTVGATASGVVVAPDGQPVAGATVVVTPERSRGPSSGPILPDPVRVRTDAEGRFVAEGLVHGPSRAVASADGFLSSERTALTAPVAGLRLALAASHTVSGSVRVRGGGPAAGVTVALDPEQRSETSLVGGLRGVTGADGSFEIAGVPGGRYVLRAVPNLHAPDVPNALPGSVGGVEAGATGVVVELEPGLVLSGRVVRADGTAAPAGDVLIDAVKEPGGGRRETSSARARVVGGAFRVVGLEPGRYTVRVESEGSAPATVTAQAGTTDLHVQLGEGGSLRGRVLALDGSAAAGATVTASRAGGGRRRSVSARTDARGVFEIRLLEPGDYSLTARSTTPAPARVSAGPVAVRDGEATEVPDLRLALPTVTDGVLKGPARPPAPGGR